jgi:hypothetical protein
MPRYGCRFMRSGGIAFLPPDKNVANEEGPLFHKSHGRLGFQASEIATRYCLVAAMTSIKLWQRNSERTTGAEEQCGGSFPLF